MLGESFSPLTPREMFRCCHHRCMRYTNIYQPCGKNNTSFTNNNKSTNKIKLRNSSFTFALRAERHTTHVCQAPPRRDGHWTPAVVVVPREVTMTPDAMETLRIKAASKRQKERFKDKRKTKHWKILQYTKQVCVCVFVASSIQLLYLLFDLALIKSFYCALSSKPRMSYHIMNC